MKTKTFLSVLALVLMISAFGQRPTLELTFTAVDNVSYIQLDSIKVINRTQGGDTVLFWPDTILVLDYQAGIIEINYEGERLHLFQNYPNPVTDHTTLTLYLPEKGKTNLVITDIAGQQVINTHKMLERGYHTFRFTPGGGKIYLFTAYWKATHSSIKILAPGNSSGFTCSLEQIESKITKPQFKGIEATQNFSFNLGDTLLYTGFANGLQSAMPDAPETSETNTFQFATNIPCPGIPTLTYEGQVYNTIQIFSQCWLKENLNVGTMINGSQNQQNNGTIEKYCYNNNPANCDTYGGLYLWDEMMQYTTTQGVQGICPPGWHIPTDEELKILESTVDSQYGVGDTIWDQLNWRGFDAGLNLKSTNGWFSGGNGTDLYGFTALPSGGRIGSGSFNGLGTYIAFWSSTGDGINYGWGRLLRNDLEGAFRYDYNLVYGFSVRCVMD
ncbi:MAG: hypothetical protein KAG99_08540 [Bacteroidales bacterium]|nr:hypothetical protein [Bacteroidales bacterium]